MKRKLNLFIIVGFLGMQMHSLLHTAEYDFDKHEHNGQVCSIYLHCEHTKYNTPEKEIILQVAESHAVAFIIPELAFVQHKKYKTSPPRAPPLFS